MTSSERNTSAGQILVVEDDPVSARFLAQVLTVRGGFDVTHTPDPFVALDRVSSETWDLVLTDVERPGMTGIELLAALRRLAPDVPVAVMTAQATLDYAVGALRNSADEFLQKPIKPDVLLATISALVAKRRTMTPGSGAVSRLTAGRHLGRLAGHGPRH
jgi:DNA-binding response OmpR family regulator